MVAEYDSAGALLRRYVHGPGVDQPLVWYEGAATTNKTWLYGDHQGSILFGVPYRVGIVPHGIVLDSIDYPPCAGNAMAAFCLRPLGLPFAEE